MVVSGPASSVCLLLFLAALLAGAHALEGCDEALGGGSCNLMQLASLDRSLTNHHANFMFFAKGLQLTTAADGSKQLHLPAGCDYKNLYSPYNGQQLAHFNVSYERASDCKRIPGTWLLGTDGHHSQQNIFEDMSFSLYPTFLASRFACNLTRASLRISHIGGTKRGWLAFHELYDTLGSYMPFEMLQSGGTIHGAGKVVGSGVSGSCLEFETAMVPNVNIYSWLSKPVQNHYNQRLATFTRNIVDGLGVRHVKPNRCKQRITVSIRNRDYRNITNMAAVIDAIKQQYPNVEVAAEDQSALPFKEQVRSLRSTNVFVFPHGGAGPLTVFLPPGGVALELFPFGFSDPMYRNMAVMTGHAYLAWQNKDITKAHDLERLQRNSNTEVDITSFMQVLARALAVSSATTSDSFQHFDGTDFNSTLCGWCEHPIECTQKAIT